MTIFTWKINSLKALSKDETTGLENVIKTIKWFYTGEAGGFTHTLSGDLNLNDPIDDQFIPWDIIKGDKNIVIAWLESNINIETLKGNIQKVLELKIKPREVTLYLEEDQPTGE